MSENTQKTPPELLGKGLKAEFNGETIGTDSRRFGFPVKISRYEVDGEGTHIDEYFDTTLTTGREIVVTGDGTVYSRTYSGGPIPSALKRLEITKDEILKYLAEVLGRFGAGTRLDGEFSFVEGDNDWAYDYRILDKVPEIGLISGKEVITYKDEIVFVHDITISPIES